LRLRIRLLALVCLAALPPLGIQAWTDRQLGLEQRARLEAQLLTEARLIAAEQAATLEAGGQLLAALAASPAVRIPDVERCTRFLTDLSSGFTAFRVLAVTDRSGRITCASRPIPAPAPSVADQAWFRKVMQENRPALGEPVPGLTTRTPQLPLGAPLRGPDGRPFGAVFAGLDLGRLSDHLAQQAEPDRAVLIVESTGGRVVAAAHAGATTIGATAPSLPRLAGDGIDSVVAASADGAWLAASTVADTTLGALTVSVSAPAASVLAPLETATRRAQLLLVAMALLALAVAVAGSRLIVERPLARLSEAMRAWRAGRYAARAELPGSGEVADLGRTFDAMAEAVESRDAAVRRAAENKARLLAAAAHDQRHRLQVLQLLVDRAAAAPPESGLDRRIVIAADASVRDLERSISQLLAASALETGGGPRPEPRVLPARLLLEQAAASVRLKAEGKALSVRVAPTRVLVRTDPAMMSTVLLNLAENAVKYTDRGGVLLGVRRGPAGQVRLAVYDTGLGIPAGERGRIFEEFNRLNPGREGLGLGLSIVRRLCDRLNHRVQVISREGRGSAFLVEVPAG
jgi:signal transduction histidine kinase